ncbi:MAG: carbohydrate kinase family protein [Proteobacteria bacterium]|jgi:sugar/nucleoside kinase (ribokinase family)|nr:carbohydrate kinase family protein [Pseudomonadota bacterium]
MFDFAKKKSYDIVGIGRNSWDRILTVDNFPKPDEKINVHGSSNQCGGQVANTIVAAAKLGAKTMYLGKFGDDAHGQAVRNALFKSNVDISEAKIIPGIPNQSAVIIVDQKNSTRNVFTLKNPKLDIHFKDFETSSYTDGKILYLGGRSIEEIKSFAKNGKDKKCIIAVDLDDQHPESDELLSHVSILFCPRSYLEQYVPGESIQSRIKLLHERHNLQVICCTLGAQGSIAFDGKQFYQKEAYKIQVTDTTGAGDVFQAGFLVALLQGKSVEECLQFANGVAALKCMHLGSQDGCPTLTEAEKFITSN